MSTSPNLEFLWCASLTRVFLIIHEVIYCLKSRERRRRQPSRPFGRAKSCPGVDMVVALAIVPFDRRRGTLRPARETGDLPRPRAVGSQTGLSRPDHHRRLAARRAKGIEFPDEACPADRSVDHERQRLAGKVVDDGGDPEPQAPGQGVGDEVQAPALVGPIGQGMSARIPVAGLQPPRRRTASPSSLQSRKSFFLFILTPSPSSRMPSRR